MRYVIELRKPACLPAYVIERADTSEDARAVCAARLERCDEGEEDDITITAVYPLQ